MSQEQPPNPLYRYVSSIERVEEVVEKNVLSFAHPSTLNDPFDCKTGVTFEGAGKRELRDFLFLTYRVGTPTVNDLQIASKVENYLNNNWPLSSDLLKSEGDTIRKIADSMARNFFICCFSETEKDLLMWAHYSNCHRGFCLQFDTTSFDSECYKMAYQETYPTLREFVECLKRERTHEIFYCRKSVHWVYEKEWRAIWQLSKEMPYGHPHHIQLPIPSASLTGVIFGCACPDEQIEWVRTFVRESGKPIKLYKAIKSQNTYSVDIREMGS